MINNVFEDPIVEIKEVVGEAEANKLIKSGWLCINTCSFSDSDGNSIYSNFKYCLALTKSVKDNMPKKSTKATAYALDLSSDM